MRAYTLTILAQCTQNGSMELATDKEIVAWVNKKLKNSGKSGQIKNFQDPAISNGRILLDLVDSIKPGTINYEIVKDGISFEVIFMLKFVNNIILKLINLKIFTLINFLKLFAKKFNSYVILIFRQNFKMLNMLSHQDAKLELKFMLCLRILLM